MMKKWLCLCLCVLLLFSLTACGKTPPVKTDDPPVSALVDEKYEEGMAKLAAGEWTEAYTLLKAATDPRAAEELEKFVFVPTETTYKESLNSADYTTTYTYDEQGNLLEDKAWGKTNWYTKKDVCINYTYDKNNRALSYTYRHSDYNYKETYTYDENGNRLSFCLYDADGVLYNRIVYTYDERGNMLTQEEYDGRDATFVSSTVYTYDDQDRLLTCTATDYDGEVTVYTYTYDEDGNYHYSYVYYTEDAWGEMVPVTYTVYFDGEERSLGYKVTTESGAVREQKEIRYDENGDNIYQRMLYNWGESYDSDSVTILTYNEPGKLLTSETTENGEITSATTYTYDEHGNQLTYDYYGGSSSWGRRVRTYDEQGNMLTHQEMGPWGWTKYTLSYDEQGNCIKEEKNGHDADGTSDYTYDEWGNRIGYRYYGTNSEGGERAQMNTAAWELHYYPDGIPQPVQDVITEANDLLNN